MSFDLKNGLGHQMEQRETGILINEMGGEKEVRDKCFKCENGLQIDPQIRRNWKLCPEYHVWNFRLAWEKAHKLIIIWLLFTRKYARNNSSAWFGDKYYDGSHENGGVE